MNVQKNTPIAVVGVSNNPEKYGHRVFKDLLHAGYTVTGINPKGGTVEGETLVTSLKELIPKPELALIVVPPEIALEVIKECHTLGIKNVWMQPGAQSKEAKKFADENKIELTANACFMVHKHLW